ncbi:hypothetical protein [Pseudobutyrivibrio sp. MD2005]|uniref:hypothetical protein n=1 Tax=Pseudobutyrivibrio sp. MD2005 TaxID=1410616 RepID=UPI0004858F5F|nr:hypothetical protein [Pseudobutyrivibrio sp. MD2005]
MVRRSHENDNHILNDKQPKGTSKFAEFFKAKKKPLAIALACVVGGVGIWQGASYTLARFNLDRAVYFTQDQLNAVSDATLIVGTHLIHISVINNQIYEVAQISQSDTGQNNLYYKSELGDGQWYEISAASALADISYQGTPVDDSEILALGLTNETRSDAITYDLRTGNPICPYNTTDPYDISDLTETMALKAVYDYDQEMINNDAETDAIEYEYHAIKYFFEHTPIRDDVTNLSDTTLDQLHQFYLTEAYQSIPLQELVQILVAEEYIDHERRAQVMANLQENGLNDLTGRLTSPVEDDGDYPDPYEDYFEDPPAATSTMATEAVSETMGTIEDSGATHESQQLVQGQSILAQCQYADLQYLYYNVSGGGFNRTGDVNPFFKHGGTGEANIQRLAAMENISESVVGYRRDLEKSILTDELVPYGTQQLQTQTTSGAGDIYQRLAADEGTTNEAKDAALDDQKSEAESTRLELQFFITNLRNRMGETDMISYIDARLDEANAMYDAVKDDPYGDYAHEVVQAYIDFLEALKSDIESGMAGGDDELQALLDEYQEGYQTALDNNDLGEADRYAALIDAVASQMGDDDGSGSAGSGLAGSAVSDLMNDFGSALGEGNAGQIRNDLNALAAMSAIDPNGVKNALNDMKKQIAASTGLSDADVDELMDEVAQAIVDGQDAFSGDISADDLDNLLNGLFGGGFDSLSDGQKVALVKATTEFGQNYNNSNVTNYGLGKLTQLATEQNPYVYTQPTEITPEYLDLEHIAAVTNYRYVFNASETRATLSNRGEYYSFVAYEDTYEDSEGVINDLNTALTFRKTVYLDEDSSDELFDCVAYYVPDTEYGIVVTDQVEDWADQIMEMLMTLL